MSKIYFNFEEEHFAYIRDVMQNLFTEKYTIQEKKNLLAHLEIEELLLQYIRMYYPKYVDENNNSVESYTLLYRIEQGYEFKLQRG